MAHFTIGHEELDALNRTLSGAFMEGLPKATVLPQAQKIAMEVKSSGKGNDYPFLGDMPTVRKWIGDRQYKELQGKTYSLENAKWENSIKVQREVMEDDAEAAISMYANAARDLGREANEHMGRLVFEVLRGGLTGDAYDGKKFFATDHPGKGGDQSNFTDGAAAPWYLFDTSRMFKPLILQVRKAPEMQLPQMTDESVRESDVFKYGTRARYAAGYGFWQLAHRAEVALDETNFQTVLQKMMQITDDEGRYLNVNPTLLVVPPALRTAALKLIEAQTVSTGGTNVNYNSVEVMVTPYVIE